MIIIIIIGAGVAFGHNFQLLLLSLLFLNHCFRVCCWFFCFFFFCSSLSQHTTLIRIGLSARTPFLTILFAFHFVIRSLPISYAKSLAVAAKHVNDENARARTRGCVRCRVYGSIEIDSAERQSPFFFLFLLSFLSPLFIVRATTALTAADCRLNA